MASAGAALDATDDVGSFIVGCDRLGRDAVTRQVGAHHLGCLGGAARRIDARRRDQPTAQSDQFLARRIDVATNVLGQAVAHRKLPSAAMTSLGRPPTMAW